MKGLVLGKKLQSSLWVLKEDIRLYTSASGHSEAVAVIYYLFIGIHTASQNPLLISSHRPKE